MLYIPRPDHIPYLSADWAFMSFFTSALTHDSGYTNLTYDDRVDVALLMLEFLIENIGKSK